MQLKGISITKGMTVNLGNYNSTRVEVGMTADFDHEGDLAAQMDDLSELVTAKLRDEVQKIAKPPKKQTLMESEKIQDA